jgi:two-component system cell cycle sensor histidine kinase/response regulator CckA
LVIALSAGLRTTVAILGLAAAYFVAGVIGLQVASAGDGHATLIWPPTGIALAALLLLGLRTWPGIAIGALAVSIFSGMPPVTMAFMVIGNTIGPVAAAWLLRRAGWQITGLGAPAGVVKFAVLGALLPSTIAAAIGALTLWLTGVTESHGLLETFLTWWMGDAMGVLMMAPVLISLATTKHWTCFAQGRYAETIGLFLALVVICLFAFGRGFASGVHEVLLVFALFPMLVLIAMRRGKYGAAMSVFILLISTAIGTARGAGPFSPPDDQMSLASMWMFMGIGGFSTLMVGAFITDRQVNEEKQRFMRFVVDHADDAVLTINEDGGFIDVNQAACSRLGYSRHELLARSVWDINADYPRDRWPQLWKNIKQDGRLLTETRHRTKSGRIISVEVLARYLQYEGRECCCAIVRDITDRKRIDEAIQYVADGISSSTGDGFFAALVKHLAEALDVDYAFVGRPGEDNPEQIQTIAVHANAQPAANFTYDLADTPCTDVMNQGFCVHRKNIQALYPKDQLLIEMSVESYAGTPLRDANGLVIGLLVVLDNKRMSNPDIIRPLVRLFGVHAARELERQRSQESLRMMQFSIDRGQDACFWIGTDLKILYVNDAACESLGYARQDLLAMSVPEIGPDRFEHTTPEDHWHSIKDAGSLTFESSHRRKDGTRLPVEISANYLEFNGKEYVFAFARNTTERKRTERDLAEKSRRIRDLSELSPVGVYRTDAAGDCTYVNKMWLEMAGIAEASAMGNGWSNAIHPDDRQHVIDQWNYCTARRIPFRAEYRFKNPKGQITWVLGRAVAEIDEQASVSGYIGTVTDITERKQVDETLRESEARWRSLTENSPDHVLTLNRDLNIEFCNFASPGMTVEQLIGTPLYSYVDTDRQSQIKALLTRVLETGEPEDYETEYAAPGGQTIYYDSRVAPRLVNDKVVGLTVNSRDITDRRKVELEKVGLEAELRQSQKMEAVGTLASGVAHDFNNLLAAICGHVELLKGALPEDHAGHQHLDIIDRVSKQGTNVTRSLLTFAHKAPSKKEPVELSGLIRDSLKMLRRLLPASIEVVEELPDKARVWVNADATQIQQVLMNLVVNARDAMDEVGSLRISLRTESQETPAGIQPDQDEIRGQVVLVIEDTGRGMDHETQARIFEPFFTSKSRENGTGLGLSVVHGIITNHGGQIEVDSQPQRGTRMVIRLTTCASPQQAAPTKTQDHPAARRGARILLAEDNAYVREIMVTALKSGGYDVVDAVDGDDAMEVFHANEDSMSLVILDLDMPKESGQACLKKIRTKREDMPAIIITGDVDLLLDRSLGNDRLPVLTKPFRMAELIDVVGQTLEQHQ